MKSKVRIALAGFGVVGSQTLQLLREHQADVESRVGAAVEVAWVLSRHKKPTRLVGPGVRQTTRWKDVVNDPTVDCVVELMGGEEPALSLVLASLRAGKHVVTANKAILAKHWDDIFRLSQLRRKLVYFEAAVGGGVPVVQAINEGLAGNRITKIMGILNGTTNYILTRMQEAGLPYAKALKEAQAAGFAEADPSFDVDGVDAAQKISILASLATGVWIPPNKVHCEGISNLRPIDLRLISDHLGSVVKLLAIAEETEDGWILRVHPTLVPKNHPFANVRNEYNAVLVHGNAAGDVILYGKGAGGMPTSSAVLSDIIFLCRQIATGTAGHLPYVSRPEYKEPELPDFDRLMSRYYLRVTTQDKPGVLSQVTGILGRHNVSIASVHQDTFEDPALRPRGVPIVLLTHECREADLQTSLKAINRMPSVRAKTIVLRME
jgi:homoserine dehydrogenase